jgi:archaellum component FlaC
LVDESIGTTTILVGDEQSRLLVKLLQAASRYSSQSMSERLRAKQEALHDIQKLMKDIQKDLANYKEMATEFTAIVKDFTSQVSNLKREASKLFHHLQSVNVQLSILVDLLLDDKRSLSDINNQNDFNECLDIIQELA